ncbi:hypothetical protein LF1_22140 [Rubripirellula obstinata]|uniref:Uncharacterized protein n=1 Tax=Rubripirellula obstinata TaxID=406547 RepID=A0A5B1CIX7_9BACT|nr:hypothetical protein [Rubripirellula obstinata]KAA1259679.1 hypothetical protein LF1_22140 [Rubripirellula obstinata]
MRIPSQFNDGNLYSQRQDRPEAGGASSRLKKTRLKKSGWLGNQHRQVVRMILALVLVMVVINAAAKPEFYQPFFVPPAVDPASLNQASLLDPSKASKPEVEIPEQVRQQSAEYAASLSADEQISLARSLIRSLDRFQNNEPNPSLAKQFDQIPIDRAEIPLDSMTKLLIRSLIVEAEKRVVDGAVWRSGDRDALRLRLLMIGQEIVAANTPPAAIVGVLSLLQQPEAFRGQAVRIHGQVARVQLISEGSNKNDPLPDYWQLWIRPSSGADRPVVALVTSLPDKLKRFHKLKRFQEGGSQNDAPRVVVQGSFFKRLAYQSSIGADLAPVVVGKLWQPESMAAASVGQSKNANEVGTIRPFVVILGAIFVGIVLAGLVVWRTAASAKRARLVRHDRDSDVLIVPPKLQDLNLEDPVVKSNHP